MIIVESILGVALAISNLCLGFMIKSWGFTLSSVPIIINCLAATLTSAFLLPETQNHAISAERSSVKEAVKRVFRFYISSKNDNPRDCYLICLAIFILGSTAFVGVIGVELLYVLNAPFSWNSVQIGYFKATKTLSQALFAAPTVKVLQFCLPDTGIAIVCGLCKAAAFVVEGFAETNFQMYLVPILGMSGIAVLSTIRSIMSKLTPQDQLGAVFASQACVQAITNMTANIVFVFIYKQTLIVYDGTVFFCVAGLVTISVILYVVLHFKLKRRERDKMEVGQPVKTTDIKRPLLGYKDNR